MMLSEFDLEPGEKVVRETRKHWLLFVVGLLPYALLALLPYVVPSLLSVIPEEYGAFRIEPSSSAMRALTGVWLLLVWTSAWGSFTRYYLNVWVLTTERIVAIKQHGYFRREVSSALLNRVQDVTSDVTGVLPSLLGLGNINVQSAGATNELHMRGIPRPEEMRDLILRHASADAPPSHV